MPTVHSFGGNWTEEKLQRLKNYLQAYVTIMKHTDRATKYTIHYMDAFAGTGDREQTQGAGQGTLDLFEDRDSQDVEIFYKGSARIALEIEPSFDQFTFIEKSREFIDRLHSLQEEYPGRVSQLQIIQGDANDVLQQWCNEIPWNRNHRAVVFLDPYGMEVRWSTIEHISQTRAIDLWLLFPLGQAVNRMLPRKRMPSEAWARRLTLMFGNDEWREEFYRPRLQPRLFDDAAEDSDDFEKSATFENIADYFLRRLKSQFPLVADRPLLLENSRRNPLFALYFATANPNAPSAISIANHLLRPT